MCVVCQNSEIKVTKITRLNLSRNDPFSYNKNWHLTLMIEIQISMSNNLDTPEFETNEIHRCIQSNSSCNTMATWNGSMMNVWYILTWQLYYTTNQGVSMMTLTSGSLEIQSRFNNKLHENWRMSMYGELHLTYSCLNIKIWTQCLRLWSFIVFVIFRNKLFFFNYKIQM